MVALVAGSELGAGASRRTAVAGRAGRRAPLDRRTARLSGQRAPLAWSPRRRSRRLEFSPTDPLATRQWYAVADRAYDAWPTLPPLAPVRVAVIDSGVDLGHPDLAAAGSCSRRASSAAPRRTRAGTGRSSRASSRPSSTTRPGSPASRRPRELLVAKVVGPAGTVSVEAEAKAIVWAVDNGARIVNMSLGGLRDPRNSGRDTYSRREEEAIRYAVRRGVVVVAAVGNGDQAPSTPWDFASYPAALPHVLGVSALARSGAAPSVLEPRRGLQRRRRSGRGHHLDLPAGGHRGAAGLRRPGLHARAPRTTSGRPRARRSPRRR